jgi:hypothetical protein
MVTRDGLDSLLQSLLEMWAERAIVKAAEAISSTHPLGALDRHAFRVGERLRSVEYVRACTTRRRVGKGSHRGGLPQWEHCTLHAVCISAVPIIAALPRTPTQSHTAARSEHREVIASGLHRTWADVGMIDVLDGSWLWLHGESSGESRLPVEWDGLRCGRGRPLCQCGGNAV